MGPPTDITGSELWRRLSELPRPHEIVDYPREHEGKPVGQLAIQVLTQEEQTAAAVAAETTTRRLLKLAGKEVPRADEAKQGYVDTYDNECAVELLFRACRDPKDTTRPCFPSTGAIRSLVSDEVGILVNLYHQVQARIGPIVSTMSDEEFDAWVELLATGASTYPLERLSWGARTDLAARMALLLWESRTGTSSSGSPPSGGSDDAPGQVDVVAVPSADDDPAVTVDA